MWVGTSRWIFFAGLLAGCGASPETRELAVAKANYDTAIEDLKACRQSGADANCATEAAVVASRERVYKTLISTRGAERAAAASRPAPDYTGMMAVGAAMMQAGQPQYPQPINVYVQQPVVPPVHTPTRW